MLKNKNIFKILTSIVFSVVLVTVALVAAHKSKSNQEILIPNLTNDSIAEPYRSTSASNDNQTSKVGCQIKDLIDPKDELRESPWNGKWIMKNSTNFTNSEVNISHATDKSFYFEIYSQVGVNTGNMDNYVQSDNCTSGELILKENVATFTDYPFDEKVECIMTFVLSKDHKTLTVKGGNDTLKGCDEYNFGFGVYADGDYAKGLKIEQIGIKDSQIFSDNPQAYDVFAKLVGKYIKLYDGTSMFQDLETYVTSGAKVQVSTVAHEADQQNIIRIGNGNKIWTAVSDFDEEKEKPIIRYFTNVPGWENKIPEDLMRWYMDNYTSKYSSFGYGTSTIVYMNGR